MAISSINFAKSSSGSFAHNDRTEKEPDYLLPVEHRLENECNRSAPEAQKIIGLSSDAIVGVLGYMAEPELVHRDNLILV